MCQNHSLSQSDCCLICCEPLLKEVSFVHLITYQPICIHCFSQLHIYDWDITFHHYPLHILYEYNDFFQTLLFQYKGLYDYALKDAFLCFQLQELKRKYRHYMIVVTPSSVEDNEKRGFAPMEAIAKTFSSHVFTGLYKKEKYKQSDLTYAQRIMMKNKIGIKNGEVLKGKKVLIIDDVITSGQTLLSCIQVVEKQRPRLIECLVLSTKRRREDFVTKGE